MIVTKELLLPVHALSDPYILLLSSGGAAAGNQFGPGSESMPTWMDDLRCEGDEMALSSCPFEGWGIENCGHSEDISVICDGGEQTTTPRSNMEGMR